MEKSDRLLSGFPASQRLIPKLTDMYPCDRDYFALWIGKKHRTSGITHSPRLAGQADLAPSREYISVSFGIRLPPDENGLR
jgi:hypothetical protein